MHAARWAGRVVAHQAPCPRPPSAVSQSAPDLSCPVQRAVSPRARARCYAPCRSPLRRAVGRWRHIAALVRCIATPGRPLLSRYNRLSRDTPQRLGRSSIMIQLIVSRHTPPARPRVRVLQHTPARGRPCHGLSQTSRGSLLAVS